MYQKCNFKFLGCDICTQFWQFWVSDQLISDCNVNTNILKILSIMESFVQYFRMYLYYVNNHEKSTTSLTPLNQANAKFMIAYGIGIRLLNQFFFVRIAVRTPLDLPAPPARVALSAASQDVGLTEKSQTISNHFATFCFHT